MKNNGDAYQNLGNKIDAEKLKGAISSAAKLGGMDESRLQNAINSGKVENVLSGLKPSQASKLQALLSNPEAMQRVLSSPQAARLLKELTK